MIWNKEVLFLHVPKTGGMSVTEFLLENLKGPVNYTADEKKKGLKRRAKFHAGQRHETLVDAESFFTYRNKSIFDFEAIFAVMRNPYDLEVSRYHYLRQGNKVDKGPAQDLAMAGDYAAYLRDAAFFGTFPPRLDRYFQFGSTMPLNLRILRYEHLDEDLRAAVGPYLRDARAQLPRLNASVRDAWTNYYDAETAELCARRHSWFFDKAFYARWTESDNATAPEAVPEPAPVPVPVPDPEPHFPSEIPEELLDTGQTMASESVAQSGKVGFERLMQGLGESDLGGHRVLDVGSGASLGHEIVAGGRAVGAYLGLETDGPLLDFLRQGVHDPRCAYGALTIDGGFVSGSVDVDGGSVGAEPFDAVWVPGLLTGLEPDDLVALLRFCRRRATPDATLVANAHLLESAESGRSLFNWLVALGLSEEAANEDTVGPTKQGFVLYSRAHLTELLGLGGWQLVEILGPTEAHSHTVVCRPG